MITQAELLNSMQQLELPEQVAAIETYIKDYPLDGTSATVISMLMMCVLMDLDGGEYPDELVKRAQTITTTLRDYNEQRFVK